MAYIVTAGLWLFCNIGLIVGTNGKGEVFNKPDQDIDVLQVIASLHAEVASLKSDVQACVKSTAAEVANLKSEVRARDKRILLHSDQDVQQVISTLQGEVASLKSQVTTLQSNILSVPLTSGSVYVRWGRTSCPGNGTEMVYRGRLAGSKWNENGGGSNTLCLPDDPTWGKHVDGVDPGGKIYGAEIQVPDNLANTLFGQVVQNEDVPCAVCRTSRPSNVMISGRANCYPGWTLEYQGYVIAGHPAWQGQTDYVCIDSGLEFSQHGAANDDDHVVVVVEAMCGSTGSLPCPPYIKGRQLSCVVCSK